MHTYWGWVHTYWGWVHTYWGRVHTYWGWVHTYRGWVASGFSRKDASGVGNATQARETSAMKPATCRSIWSGGRS